MKTRWYSFCFPHNIQVWYSSRSCLTQFIFAWFSVVWLEHLHPFLNLCDNFYFNAIFFCRRLAGSNIIVMPSVTYMDWLHWWFSCTDHLVSSQHYWHFLQTWLRNVNLHHLVKSMWKKLAKNKEYCTEIRHNKPTWKRRMNCWHML